MSELKAAIQQRARELGFDACRFTTALAPEHRDAFQQWLAAGRHGALGYMERNANKRVDPGLVLSGAKTIISLAVSYAVNPQPSFTASSRQGRIARYACFPDYHDVMGEQLIKLTAFLHEAGGSDTQSLWYVDTGPLLERDLAQRAGLGFAGKHTNLISRELGNWILLGEIITTLELEPDPSEQNRCGSCRRCLDACPTGALTRPFELDARLCISYLTIEFKGAIPLELRPLIGNRIFGCDDCLAACPWNRFAREGALMRPHFRADLQTPDLLGLLALDEPGFKARFAGTPMLRAKRRGLLRNVCVALGNIAGAEALAALEKAANEPEPLIAEHARWAIEQITARLQSAKVAP